MVLATSIHHTLFACSLALSGAQYWSALCPAVRGVGTWGPLLPTWSFRSSEELAGEPGPRFLLGRNLQSAPGEAEPEAGSKPWGGVRVRAPLESPSNCSSGPGRMGGAEVAGAHRPVSGLGELERRQSVYPRRLFRARRGANAGLALLGRWFLGVSSVCRKQDRGPTGQTDPEN